MRVLIVRLSAIGDVLHTLPALELLRLALPGAELTWAVEPPAASLLVGHPALDRVVTIDRPALARGPRRLGALRAALSALRGVRASRPDAALDLQGLLRSAVVARASGAPRVLGPSWGREGVRHLYTDALDVPRPEDAHAAERYVAAVRASLRALGVPVPEGPVPPPRLTVDAHVGARSRVVLLPGAGKPANRPPARLLARVADQLADACPEAELLLVGGPGDAPRARAVLERCRLARPLDVTGRYDLRATAGVLAGAAVVIGGDTGPLHLARVLGRPIVALFHAADPARTGPLGLPGASAVHVVRGEAPCAPCCARRCLRPDRVRICLQGGRAEEVAGHALELLAVSSAT